MLEDQPNFVGAEIMILRRTSLSNQFQNRLRFLRGESRCEGLGMAMDPHRRAITMLHIKEWFLLKSPLRKNIVSKSLKEKFKSCWIKISSLQFPLKTKTMISLNGICLYKEAIFTPDRTTQVRLVFDTSAKGPRGKSLNEHLEKGPNYISRLPNVLMAWRFDKVAYTGDVRKMFNQVLIHPTDQVFHRFLWRTNESLTQKVYQWNRHLWRQTSPRYSYRSNHYLS